MTLSAICIQAQPILQPFSLSDVVFEADELERTGSGNIIRLKGGVILDNGESLLFADSLTLDTDNQRALAQGRVRLELAESSQTDPEQPGRTQILADSLWLDQETTTLLLSGLAVRLRNQGLLAASQATSSGEDLRLSYLAYTACEAPCDIDEHRKRDPLPWQLTAREADLNTVTDRVRLSDVQLELFEVPVARWPYSLNLPAPYVERQSGLLGPVGGFSREDGAWAGLPLYLSLGDSADTTLTPIAYSSALGRLDTEVRIATQSVEAESRLSFDTDGEGGAMVESRLSLSPTLALNLDWVGETRPGALERLQQGDEALHVNSLTLESARGHSYVEGGFYQNRLLSPDPGWLSLDGWARDWHEDWVPRAQYDLRLPPLAAGNRLRLQGQGLRLHDRLLVSNQASYAASMITRSGLKLSPRVTGGWVGDEAEAKVSGWLGGQLKAALPLTRHSPWSSTTLTPSLAVTGLSGLSTNDSPYQDSSVLSRSNLFKIRDSSDPFNHASDIRGDAAFDFALYPTGVKALGLRGSLGQRVSWHRDALAATTAGLFLHAGDLSVDLRAHIDLGEVRHPSIDWNQALPRLALDIDVPLTPWLSLSGKHHRLTTDQDLAESNRLQMDFSWGGGLSTHVAVTTDQQRDGSDMGLETGLSWNVQGDWVVETALRQNVFDLDDQDLSFDLYHRCQCLGAQIGYLRERRAEGTDHSARFALDLPTLFSGAVSPRLPRRRDARDARASQ